MDQDTLSASTPALTHALAAAADATGGSIDNAICLDSPDSPNSLNSSARPAIPAGPASVTETSHGAGNRLFALPPELLEHILSFLSPADLALVVECVELREAATANHLWQRHVQANVPGIVLSTPYPFWHFLDLYVAHEPWWFLARRRVWFSDEDFVGRLVIMRYNPWRGYIEGYDLVGVPNRKAALELTADNGKTVMVHESFDARAHLHLDRPVLELIGGPPHTGSHKDVDPTWDKLYKTLYGEEAQDTFRVKRANVIGVFPAYGFTSCTNFELARVLRSNELSPQQAAGWDVWPPHTIPSSHRVSRLGGTQPRVNAKVFRPECRAEVSDLAFHLSRCIAIPQSVQSAQSAQSAPASQPEPTPLSHSYVQIKTFASLDRYLYTPTDLCPWRGIWAGDYTGHGCEFLLFVQSDEPAISDEEIGLRRDPVEDDDRWQSRLEEARKYRGRLTAVKLTGDANVPRGELSFVVEDLSLECTSGLQQGSVLDGARVAPSRGHIADRGFYDEFFIDTKIFFISHDRIAQYWVEYGHVNFYHRIDIDKFLGM